jgi:hypothetical protein
MFNYKKTALIAFAFLITISSMAQAANAPDTTSDNGFMRSEGKIYVVMVVVITILAGLILYLLRLDKKLSKLEKGGNF